MLSIILAIFAVAGWLLRGGILPWPGFDELTAENSIPALYAALALVMQITAAVASIAARRAAALKLDGSAEWSRYVVGAAGLWNAYSLHNAFEQGLPEGAGWFTQGIAWAVSVAVAFVEIAIYIIDESIKSRAEELRRRDQSEALADAAGRSMNVHRMDERAMSDDALVAAIAQATGMKRRLEVERKRRIKRNIVAKEG